MSETTVALYRTYRPETFSDVRGQEHIVSVLAGAIKKKQIPHALLFCGSRGTGKTTLARIFAREIGVSPVDLYEIDAASNRGIDDVRALREAVHTVPYESERKVYIIDEVHMLTKEAFNALLKTLEEPPPHVVFILATTEEDKLLDTIRSRCQVFNFRAPSRAILTETITAVAKKEKFKLTPEATELIVTAADGSFRDALGVLQKVMLASGDTVGEVDEVAALIGAPRRELVGAVVKGLHEADAAAALAAVAKATAASADANLFIRLILEQVRTVILLRHQPNQQDELLAVYNPDTAETLAAYATASGSPLNSHVLRRLLQAALEAKQSDLPHLSLEIAIVELCQAKQT
jgi:DNA polymerase-3 subunit gamma/tau